MTVATAPHRRSAAGLLALLVALPAPGLGAQEGRTAHVVASDGAAAGAGTDERPWSLAHAAGGAGGRVRPGDTVWVRGGRYVGEVIVSAAGTEARPVILRARPGERATIDGNVAVVGAGNVWLWGLEVRGTAPTVSETMGVNVRAPGVRLINLVVHHAGMSGVGHWMEAPNGEVYGSLIYRNGTHGHFDHGVYAQNATGTKRLEDNLVWENSGYGFHLYTSKDQYTRNVTLRGNVAWANGTAAPRPDYFVGGNTPASGIVVDSNASWRGQRRQETADLGWRYAAIHRDLTFRDNYLVGGVNLPGRQWQRIVQERNRRVGFFRPRAAQVMVRRNRYEPGRANLAVWNWRRAPVVTAPVPGAGAWRLQRADDFFGPPVATGTGPTVPVPMGGAEFAAFVLLPR